MCTQSRMQNVLKTSKKLHARDAVLQLGLNRGEQRAQWTRSIIRDELNKPLAVSDQFMKEFTKKKVLEDSHFRTASKNHVRSMKRIMNKEREKEDQRIRNKEFNEKKRLLFSEPIQ